MKWSPTSSTRAARHFVAPIPYAGEVAVVVTSIPEQPSFLVAKTNYGKPREEFVRQQVAKRFGQQPDGSPHTWKLEDVPGSESRPVTIPVDSK